MIATMLKSFCSRSYSALYVPTLLLLLVVSVVTAFLSLPRVSHLHEVHSNSYSLIRSLHFCSGNNVAWQRLARRKEKNLGTTITCMVKYGLPDDDDDDWEAKEEERLKGLEKDFRRLLNDVKAVQDPSHIPSLLTKNMGLILTMPGESGVKVIESILQETMVESGEKAAEQVSQAIEMVITFAEEFVQQTSGMEDQNKKLLGKIILAISDKESTADRREQALDELIAQEKDKFTAGFLRHVEGECMRISNARKITPESSRLLEVLRIIETRILEELISEQEWGQAAQVLGQLIGYDDKQERIAVLEAGLTVRGVDFAKELIDLTAEALEGFQRVPGGADPTLVEIIQDIDKRIKQYVDDHDKDSVFQ